MSAKLKKGDTVMVIAGRSKGKTGKIQTVFPAAKTAIVEGVNLIKRHQRQSATQEGGIIEKPAPIAISNIAYYDSGEKKASRVRFGLDESGKKIRVSVCSGKTIDA